MVCILLDDSFVSTCMALVSTLEKPSRALSHELLIGFAACFQDPRTRPLPPSSTAPSATTSVSRSPSAPKQTSLSSTMLARWFTRRTSSSRRTRTTWLRNIKPCSEALGMSLSSSSFRLRLTRATANPDTSSHPLEHGLRCVIVWTDGDEKAVQKSVMAFSYICDSLMRKDDM